MGEFSGRTALISGASRGIGLAIALELARRGANVAVAACVIMQCAAHRRSKTSEPNPKLPGTIHEAVTAIEKAGGKGLAIVMDVRDADSCEAAVKATVERFGSIDILINNASAISLTPTSATSVKKWAQQCPRRALRRQVRFDERRQRTRDLGAVSRCPAVSGRVQEPCRRAYPRHLAALARQHRLSELRRPDCLYVTRSGCSAHPSRRNCEGGASA